VPVTSQPPELSLRDPIHGFLRADPLEAALINCRPVQRLRFVHQLGLSFLVFPGAEHSRFSHVLGAMHLAGRVYDALAARGDGVLPVDPGCRERRLVRVAALVHDIGHAPFSHTAEGLFEDRIDHEEMTRRLLSLDEVRDLFDRHGDGLRPEDVAALLATGRLAGERGDEEHADGERTGRLLFQILSGELDVDKMDYLLRDSLYCGVRYGSYDLDRLLLTMIPVEDPETGELGIGVEAGGLHALEALVMARYYMFTQVYFNVTGKALELHLNEWLGEQGFRWPSDPEAFLDHDDVSVLSALRRSESLHARGVVDREHFPLAFETVEHLDPAQRDSFEALLPALRERFGADRVLVSHSSKDSHKLDRSRMWVRSWDGRLTRMEEASHFLRHLGRIDCFRVYTPPEITGEVAADFRERWEGSG
jgi:HD superfamily phosphohydrolase